jgi:hypothetical protein
MTCDEGRERIARVSFVGWAGLPPGCRPGDLFERFPREDPADWPRRPLGEDYEPVAFAQLDLARYYRPAANLRDGALVLFDGMNPQLDGGLEPLLADLGAPAVRLDYAHGTLGVGSGELVFCDRGITLFVNTTGDTALHVALYHVTTVDDYRRRLRLHLGKTLRPRPVPGEA